MDKKILAETIKEIATPQQFRAWQLRKRGLDGNKIAQKMGLSESAVSQLKSRLNNSLIKIISNSK